MGPLSPSSSSDGCRGATEVPQAAHFMVSGEFILGRQDEAGDLRPRLERPAAIQVRLDPPRTETHRPD
jgi:hypothetical protein